MNEHYNTCTAIYLILLSWGVTKSFCWAASVPWAKAGERVWNETASGMTWNPSLYRNATPKRWASSLWAGSRWQTTTSWRRIWGQLCKWGSLASCNEGPPSYRDRGSWRPSSGSRHDCSPIGGSSSERWSEKTAKQRGFPLAQRLRALGYLLCKLTSPLEEE